MTLKRRRQYDVEAAIKCLRIANRNGADLAMMNLAVAVALTALGVPKEQVMAEAKKGQENRRRIRAAEEAKRNPYRLSPGRMPTPVPTP